MKNLIFVVLVLGSIAVTPGFSQSKSKLTGNWTGTLYQNPNGALAPEYKFSMRITDVNGVVTGVSTIISGPNYGVLDFKGTFKKDSLFVEEYQIEKQKMTTTAQWCFKKGKMRMKTEGTKLMLTGSWTGYAMWGTTRSECSPGTMVLTKEQGFISLKGHVVDENIKAIPANIKIVNKKTGKQVANLKTTTGEFDISLPGKNDYELTVESKGYLTRYEHVTLNQSIILNIPLSPIVVGQTIAIPFILFEQSTSTLTKDSYPALDRLFKFMTDNPTVGIELQGHTSNEGDPKKNIELSQQRVTSIKNVLIQKGREEPLPKVPVVNPVRFRIDGIIERSTKICFF